MAHKPSVAIVGAGNLASALAPALRNAGYRIVDVISRDKGKSFMRGRRLARRVRAHTAVIGGPVKADILWLCVPDGQIAGAAGLLAKRFEGKIALHSSGALTSDELSALRHAGAAVTSVHPLMTFVGGSHPDLNGVPFALEGDAAAVRAAKQIVRDLGGEAFRVSKEKKTAYHAWGTFASPLLTALLATTERVAALAGIRGQQARRRMSPILLQTVRNYESLGASAGFSGPIVRGDSETVRRHLELLKEEPVLHEVYLALARAALAYLPAKNKKRLQQLLSDKGAATSRK